MSTMNAVAENIQPASLEALLAQTIADEAGVADVAAGFKPILAYVASLASNQCVAETFHMFEWEKTCKAYLAPILADEEKCAAVKSTLIIIPANCKVWFDGCNTCTSTGKFHSCTRKLCDETEAAKCLDETGHLNVYGKPLADCSGPGMALTGFTRNGKCVDKDDDAGSHHVCIEMDSAAGSNFCTVTGQDNWCESQMPCADGAQPGGASEAILECPVRNWCVCEWAFKDYIAAAGGCDAIKNINCDATNALAVAHYEAKGPEAADALACLESRCGLDAKTVDEAYKEFDKKEPWDEVLS